MASCLQPDRLASKPLLCNNPASLFKLQSIFLKDPSSAIDSILASLRGQDVTALITNMRVVIVVVYNVNNTGTSLQVIKYTEDSQRSQICRAQLSFRSN